MLALWIGLGVLALLIAADIAFAVILIEQFLVRKPTEDEREVLSRVSGSWVRCAEAMLPGLDWLDAQPSETVEIKSHEGLVLRGTFIPADTPTGLTLLCMHGYTSTGRMDYCASAPYLHSLGYNILLPDQRSHGRSEGRIIGFSCLEGRDAVSWCRYLEERLGGDCRIMLMGISMGASTVINAAAEPDLPDCVRAVLADCGFSSGWEEIKHQLQRMKIPPFPVLPTADLLLRIFGGYSLRRHTPLENVGRIRVPLLIVHGLKDNYVPTRMGRELYEAAKCDKQLMLVEDAGHGQSYIFATERYHEALLELECRAGMCLDFCAPLDTSGRNVYNNK